jgi:hypothetical protein
MTAQPLNSDDRASTDGLRDLFSTIVEEEVEVAQATATEVDATRSGGEGAGTVENIYPQSSSEEQPRPAFDGTKISRSDLVNVLESFVNLIKASTDLPAPIEPAQNTISFDPQVVNVNARVSAVDKTAEVEELRCLLVEAQETIIRLLTDRVEDRSRIASLEAELRLLPDLQNQADRAIAAAINTEDFRRELTKMKFEIERVRLAKVREEIDRSKRSFWSGVRGWLFKVQEENKETAE